MKILFATDLDNTLISSKHNNEYCKCVEQIDGVNSTYMPIYAYDLLTVLVNAGVDIVPITTRTINQYKRINLPPNCVKTAVVSNGAFIIEDNLIANLVRDQNYFDTLESIGNNIKDNPLVEKFRWADDVFVYAVCKNVEDADKLCEQTNDMPIKPMRSGRKVYYIPEVYRKENALKYIADNDNYDLVIAAGDSDLDVGMLNAADIAIIPESLKNKVNARQSTWVCPDTMNFPTFITTELLTRIVKQKNN